jgi:AdoMet dependent proline di-methyltransferase
LKSDELWKQEMDADGTHKTWYAKAVDYWDKQEASYNGVLGGFERVSDVDIRDSRQLLLKVRRWPASQCWHSHLATGAYELVAAHATAAMRAASQVDHNREHALLPD